MQRQVLTLDALLSFSVSSVDEGQRESARGTSDQPDAESVETLMDVFAVGIFVLFIRAKSMIASLAPDWARLCVDRRSGRLVTRLGMQYKSR